MVRSPHTSIRTTRTVLAVAAVATLFLTACSQATTDSGDSGVAESTLTPPTILSEGQLRVCTTGSNPPNTYYDADANVIGVEVDMANILANQLGLEPKIEEYAFAGLIPALQAKQCDVIMGSLYITTEREEIANFVPYLYSGTGAGVSTENPMGITGVDTSLCGARIIGITGATGANGAEELSANCKAEGLEPLDLTLVDDGTSAVQQVISGQMDAFIDTSELMSYYAQEADGAFKVVGDPVGKIQIGAATLIENTDLNAALDEAFQALLDDGSYLKVLEEWGVEGNDITLAE